MKPYTPAIDYSQEIQAAVTKTADFDGAFLDLGSGFEAQGLGHLLAAVVTITALDFTTGNETYALKLQQAPPDSAGIADTAAITDCGPTLVVTATGVAVVKGIVTQRFVRLCLDVAGTTPSLTYSAHLGR